MNVIEAAEKYGKPTVRELLDLYFFKSDDGWSKRNDSLSILKRAKIIGATSKIIYMHTGHRGGYGTIPKTVTLRWTNGSNQNKLWLTFTEEELQQFIDME